MLMKLTPSFLKQIHSVNCCFPCLTYLRGIPRTVVDTEERRHTDEPERLPDVHAQVVVDNGQDVDAGSKSDGHPGVRGPVVVTSFLLLFLDINRLDLDLHFSSETK